MKEKTKKLLKKQSPKFKKSMAYLTKKLAGILWEGTMGNEEKEKKDVIEKFLTILKEKKKEYLLKDVVKELDKIKEANQNKLILSRQFDSKTINSIKERAEKYFNNGGEWKVKINKEIIGGFIVKNQTFLIDASIKKILNKIFNKI